MIDMLANELPDSFVAQGNVNINSNSALPLPLKVVTAVVGIDPTH